MLYKEPLVLCFDFGESFFNYLDESKILLLWLFIGNLRLIVINLRLINFPDVGEIFVEIILGCFGGSTFVLDLGHLKLLTLFQHIYY